MTYFNEIDEVACAVLRANYEWDVIDGRSIKDVEPSDIRPFRRAHFFAGAGIWEAACRLAGWPAYRELWTASCPCQPFSAAGKGLGTDDPRHLWPDLFRLVDACRPACIVGEQVAGKAGDAWLDGVCADLESIGYAVRAVEVPASAVDSPQKRSRNWWVAVDNGGRDGEQLNRVPTVAGGIGENDGISREANGTDRRDARPMASADGGRRDGWTEDALGRALGGDVAEWTDGAMGDCDGARADFDASGCGPRATVGESDVRSFWAESEWLQCADGKARRTKPGLRLLVDGMAGRTDLWRLAGNSIVPLVAAQVLSSILES